MGRNLKDNTSKVKKRRLRDPEDAIRRRDETFEKLKARNEHKHIKRRISYVVIGFVVCIAFLSVCFGVLFKVDEITVRGTGLYSTEEVISKAGIEVGQTLYSIDKKKVEQNIKLNFPYIKNVYIDRQIPSTVELILYDDVPLFYIQTGGEYFLLSDTFRVLERTYDFQSFLTKYPQIKKLSLPDVIYAVVGKEIKFKKEYDAEYVKAFVTDLIKCEMFPSLQVINAEDKYGLYVVYSDKYKIIMGDGTDTDVKLTFASNIISSMDMETKGRIDVSMATEASLVIDANQNLD